MNTEVLKHPPETTEDMELSSLRAEIKASDETIQRMRQQIKERDLKDRFSVLMDAHQWASRPARESAFELMRDRLVLEGDGTDARLIVLTADGAPIVGRHGFLEPSQFLQEWCEENPNFIRNSGNPTNAQHDSDAISRSKLERLFGNGGDAKQLNAIANKNINEYRKLRAEAKRLGIVK